MPTWCENKLEVYSLKKEKLKEFVEKAKDHERKTDLSFQKLYPCPEELLQINPISFDKPHEKEAELTEKYGFRDWYFWRVGNWGTKWDVEAKLVNFYDSLITYEFDTAWAPPISLIINIVKAFPDLVFILKYDSVENGYKGIFIAHGENEILDEIQYWD